MSMRAAWFIPVNHRDYDHLPASVWIRCLQLIPYLEESGVHCNVNEPNAKADIAIFVRWQDEEAYKLARKQKEKGRRIVFDLCVNYFEETDVPYIGRPVTKKHVDECLHMLSVADVVTCASAYIAQRAREFASWVEYLPDSINRRHFYHTKLVENFYQPKLRAIWSGIATKAGELDPILPLLRERNISLTIISNQKPALSIPYRFLDV